MVHLHSPYEDCSELSDALFSGRESLVPSLADDGLEPAVCLQYLEPLSLLEISASPSLVVPSEIMLSDESNSSFITAIAVSIADSIPPIIADAAAAAP